MSDKMTGPLFVDEDGKPLQPSYTVEEDGQIRIKRRSKSKPSETKETPDS